MKTFEKEVICQICGFKHSRTLQGHIKKQHKNISIKEYKEKYRAEIVTEELKIDRRKKSSVPKGPMSEEEKKKRSLANKQFWKNNIEKRQEVSKRMKKLAEKGKHNFQREEVKLNNSERLTILNKDEDHISTVRNAMTGKKLPREQVEKSAAGHRGIPCSEESKRKNSETKRRLIREGKLKLVHPKIQGYYINKEGEKVPYMSQLELLYFRELDANNKKWEYEPFIIQYILDGKERNYFPDVLVDNKYVVEVKSKYFWMRHLEMCEAKAKAARQFCRENGYEYKILYEDYFGVDYKRKFNYNFPTC